MVLKLSLPRWTLAGVSRQCEMGISVALLSVWEDWHGSVQTLTEELGDLGCFSRISQSQAFLGYTEKSSCPFAAWQG